MRRTATSTALFSLATLALSTLGVTDAQAKGGMSFDCGWAVNRTAAANLLHKHRSGTKKKFSTAVKDRAWEPYLVSTHDLSRKTAKKTTSVRFYNNAHLFLPRGSSAPRVTVTSTSGSQKVEFFLCAYSYTGSASQITPGKIVHKKTTSFQTTRAGQSRTLTTNGGKLYVLFARPKSNAISVGYKLSAR